MSRANFLLAAGAAALLAMNAAAQTLPARPADTSKPSPGLVITPTAKPVSVSAGADSDVVAVSQTYATQAKIIAEYQVAASRIALGMSTDEEVRAYSFQLSQQQSADAAALAVMLVELGAGASPKTDPEHHALLDRLGRASVENFNRTFLEQQVESHKEALAMHAAYYARGTSDALVAFAGRSSAAARIDLAASQRLLDLLSAKDIQTVDP